MIYLIFLWIISVKAFYTYEKMQADLISVKKAEHLTIGKSQNNEPIQAVKLMANSQFNCLIIGGIDGKDQSSTIQVMENLHEAQSRQKVLEANVWFIPVLNPDLYLKTQELYLKGESIQNSKDSDGHNNRNEGINHNMNYADGYRTNSDSQNRVGNIFSWPETQALLSFIKSFDFHLIITYCSGDVRYIVPESFPTNPIVPLVHEDFGQTIAGYGNTQGIFSVAAFINEENLAEDPRFTEKHSSIFFEFLHRLGPSLNIVVENEMKNGTGIIWIYIQNKGLYDSDDAVLVVQSNEEFFHTVVTVQYDFTIDSDFFLEKMNVLKTQIKQLKPGHLAKVTVVYSYEDSQDHSFKIWTQDAKETTGSVKSAGLVGDQICILFGLLTLFGIGLAFGIWISKRDNDKFAGRQISIPNRPLPWEELSKSSLIKSF